MNCTNIVLEDFTIGSRPNWTFHPIYCQNITIRRVTVETDGPNNDGIDPDSCRDMLIEHCTFSTGDKLRRPQLGHDEDGWRGRGGVVENLYARNFKARLLQETAWQPMQ